MLAQKIFVETSVALKVGTVDLPERDWQAAVHRLSADFEFVVSPLTFFEVLNRLAGGSEEYILRNARALSALSPINPLAPTFLEMPGQFIFRQVLECQPIADTFQPEHLQEAMTVILEHRELTPELRAWLAEVRQMHRSGKQGHVDKCREMQRTGRTELHPGLWVREIFRQMGIISLSKGEIEKSVSALDAAREYTDSVRKQLENPQYVPTLERSGSNWIDTQQLLYLCDPSVHILYLDRHFETRTGVTSQRAQLLNVRKLMEMERLGATLA